MEALAGDWRIIAPDTPGYGLSEPFDEDAPSLDDFAVAMIGFMDAMGLNRTALYGTHTGADIAMAMARRYPERFSCVVLDGVSAGTGPYKLTQWDVNSECTIEINADYRS